MNPFKERRRFLSSPCIAKPLRIFYPTRTKLITVGVLFLVVIYIFQNHREELAHITRPIWDKKPKPWTDIIINYDLTSPQDCDIYGWNINSNFNRTRIIDTFLFNNELDWLEIRLNELNDVVDYFIILEATRTFTNIPKPLVLNETLTLESTMYRENNINESRFLKFQHKIIHVMETQDVHTESNTAFSREGAYRERLVKHGFPRIPGGMHEYDIVIVADLDEVPRSNVLRIAKSCTGWPSPLYLRTTRYLYSFEFPMGTTEHTSLWHWGPGSVFFGHKRMGNTIVQDAGWHCSFCFKYLEDFVTKMESYSHFDRAKEEHKKVETIQKKICEGKDLFDRQPMEAYTFRDMVMSYGHIPSHLSAVSLPSYVVHNHKRFSYLLPGYCKRPRMRNNETLLEKSWQT